MKDEELYAIINNKIKQLQQAKNNGLICNHTFFIGEYYNSYIIDTIDKIFDNFCIYTKDTHLKYGVTYNIKLK